MTALEQYIRLEAEALWCENAGAEPRPVIVSFGNASLVISDFNDAPLAHWSLAATRIVARKDEGVVYAPDDTNSETLRISDQVFVDAIRAVSASTLPKKPPKHWKFKVFGSLVLCLLIAGVVFVPKQVRDWVAGHVSHEQLVLISDEILDRADFGFCSEVRADEAMAKLEALLLRPTDAKVSVADMPAAGIVRLPDGRAIMDVSVLERGRTADGFAGWLALAANLPGGQDGLDDLIRSASTSWALRFAFTGELSDEELDQIAEYSLQNATLPDPKAVAASLGRLQAEGIDPTAFRKSINLPAEQITGPFRPALGDQDWFALQTICGL